MNDGRLVNIIFEQCRVEHVNFLQQTFQAFCFLFSSETHPLQPLDCSLFLTLNFYHVCLFVIPHPFRWSCKYDIPFRNLLKRRNFFYTVKLLFSNNRHQFILTVYFGIRMLYALGKLLNMRNFFHVEYFCFKFIMVQRFFFKSPKNNYLYVFLTL